MDKDIRRAKRILEAAGYTVEKKSPNYEEFTEKMLSEELEEIENDIDYISSLMHEIYYDDRGDLEKDLDKLHDKLFTMEEYLNDSQYKKMEELLSSISTARDIEYDGPTVNIDPYKERGLRYSDFY